MKQANGRYTCSGCGDTEIHARRMDTDDLCTSCNQTVEEIASNRISEALGRLV